MIGGMLPVMILSFRYLVLRQVLQLMILLARGDRANVVEVLVLPHRAPRGATNRVGVKDRHRRPVAAGR
jgi:hypothetical protein